MDLSLRLIDWSAHGGSACYQVGSHLYSGRRIEKDWLTNAHQELVKTLATIQPPSTYTDHDRNDLRQLIEDVDRFRDSLFKET